MDIQRLSKGNWSISLGIGISGIYCGLQDDAGTSIPLVIIVSCFLIGAGINHIKEILTDHNTHTGNVLIILPDFAIPLTLIVLLILRAL